MFHNFKQRSYPVEAEGVEDKSDRIPFWDLTRVSKT